MIVKLLTEHHLELLGLTGGCRGSSESTQMPHCWKSHALAHIIFTKVLIRTEVGWLIPIMYLVLCRSIMFLYV